MRLTTFVNSFWTWVSMHLARTAKHSGHVFAGLLVLSGYLAISNNASADWINTTSPGQQTTAVGTNPSGIGLDVAGRRGVVLNKGANSASLVNLDTGRVTASIALTDEPDAVVVDAQSGRAYVLHEDAKISVINLNTQARQTVWSVPGEPKTAVLAASGTELIIAIDDGKKLIRVSTVNGQVLQTIALANEPQALALAPDEKRLFVATESQGIRVLDTATWKEIGNIAVPDVKAMVWWKDRKSTRLNSSHLEQSRMPSSA